MITKNGAPYFIDHIPLSSRRPGIIRKPKTLTVHSTGNLRSTARNERDWLVNPRNTRLASWHVVVDEKEAVEAIPPNEVAWHAGDGRRGEGNAYSIGVEICESGDRAKTLNNAARVIAALLREYGLVVADIRQHFDWNKKNCPRILRTGKLWNEFLAAIGLNYEITDHLQAEEVRRVFRDMTDHWARGDIEWLAERGIVAKAADFRPNDTVNRAQMAVFLRRAIEYVLREVEK
jgi:N-acetylmuramoyl-L-alanine amidase